MICPVSVANEMSGLKGRVELMSHPNWRLGMDAVISGSSFGAGHEDTRSDHTSDERKDQLVGGRRDHRDNGQEHAAMAQAAGRARLRRIVRWANAADE